MISLDEIRSGLKNGEFFLEYLPTISLENHCCIGAEALIRWRRPTGVLLPESFIPLVDNTPLSGLITYWVIETVAEELGEWLRANDGIHLGINVPPEVLGRGGLEYAAEKSGLMDVLDKLVIEVTERGVPDKQGVDAIRDAARARVLVALDDVGVEDANLVLLSRVKVDIIKIDKSFARQMLTENWSPDRIQGLSALIHATGHTIIVEGVESELQVDILKQAGIKVVQGWYFSPSLPAKEFEAFFYQNQG
jgi:sensor c-di-GMP phosphodiesterase-like protein